jgi:hypothetical protein
VQSNVNALELAVEGPKPGGNYLICQSLCYVPILHRTELLPKTVSSTRTTWNGMRFCETWHTREIDFNMYK